MNGADDLLQVDEDLVPGEEQAPPSERDLVEELIDKTGVVFPIDFPLGEYMKLTDMSDDLGGIVYATVGFVPPESAKGKEPMGEGKFHMTFKVMKGEVRLVDWLAE